MEVQLPLNELVEETSKGILETIDAWNMTRILCEKEFMHVVEQRDENYLPIFEIYRMYGRSKLSPSGYIMSIKVTEDAKIDVIVFPTGFKNGVDMGVVDSFTWVTKLKPYRQTNIFDTVEQLYEVFTKLENHF